MDFYFLLVLVVFYLTLYFLILIHEVGHLIVAKVNKVLCRSFTIGAGPILFSFRIGETNYIFKLLPMVGGVEMAGEDGSDFDNIGQKRAFVVLNKAKQVTKLYINPTTTMKDVNQVEGRVIKVDLRRMTLLLRTDYGDRVKFKLTDQTHIYDDGDDIQMAPVNRRFWSKSAKQKIAIILGGPIVNIAAAMATFAIMGVFLGVPGQSLLIEKVHTNSIAARSGIQTGDTIIAINDTEVTTKDAYLEHLDKTPSTEPYNVTIMRSGEKKTFVIPHLKSEKSPSATIGIETKKTYGVIDGLQYGMKISMTMILSIILGLIALFKLDFANLTLGGPLSIFQQSDKIIVSSPYESVMLFIAMMSLNLGLLNLFPIPLLDGGRIVNVAIEKVTHRKMSRKAETFMALIGITILVAFVIIVTLSDLQRILNY